MFLIFRFHYLGGGQLNFPYILLQFIMDCTLHGATTLVFIITLAPDHGFLIQLVSAL